MSDNREQNAAPERIYLPRDTDADSWSVLAKNPSRDWSTGEAANNIEYVRADLLSRPSVVTERELAATDYRTRPQLTAVDRFEWRKAFNDYRFKNCDHEHEGYPNHLACIECVFECFEFLTTSLIQQPVQEPQRTDTAELDKVLAQALVEDPMGVRLAELELERLQALEEPVCVECGHRSVDKNGVCQGYVMGANGNFSPCIHKCIFPATGPTSEACVRCGGDFESTGGRPADGSGICQKCRSEDADIFPRPEPAPAGAEAAARRVALRIQSWLRENGEFGGDVIQELTDLIVSEFQHRTSTVSAVPDEEKAAAEKVAIAGIQEGLRQRDALARAKAIDECVTKVERIANNYDKEAFAERAHVARFIASTLEVLKEKE